METGTYQQTLAKFYTIKLVEISCVVIQLFHLYRQTGRQTDRQTDRQTERQTDRKTDRQTDRQSIFKM